MKALHPQDAGMPGPILARLGLLAVLAILWSCQATSTPGTGELNDQLIVPRSSGAIKLFGDTGHQTPDRDASESGSSLSTKAVLPEDCLVQATFDLNLDLDTAVEQVAVYKTTSDSGNLLNLALIDQDPQRSTYFLAQTLPTLSINIRTFTLRLLDLTHDNIPELVASGLDAEGRQTLDIFLLSTSNSSEAEAEQLKFVPGINLSSDISIELRSRETSPGADSDVDVLPRYDILVQNRANATTLDLTEMTYAWNEGKLQFQLTTSRLIPGKVLQEAQLKGLENASVEDFERFISGESGAWYRNIKDKRGQTYMQILFFEPEARSFRLIEGDRMESYIWKTSTHPALGSRLQIFLQNESFKLRSMATIIPNSSNEMTFYLQDKSEWSGTFYRLSTEQEQEMKLGQYKTSLPINPLILSGLFKSEAGGEIVFSAPWFTWRQGERQKRGGYLTYQLNQTVLELQSISDKGLVEEKEYYIIKTLKTDSGSVPQYELVPASLTINGIAPKNNEIIRIQQVSTETN